MSDRQEIRVRISELSNEDLFKMVNEEIINYQKEEINLAYEEMEGRGLLPTDEPQLDVSTVGRLIGLAILIVKSLIIDSHQLSYPRAIALASFVSLIGDYWHRPKPTTTFWTWALLAASIVLLGSLALWEIPNLLRQQTPLMLAFGIPTLIYSLASYWMLKLYRPWRKTKFTTWLVGCLIFTILYSWLMSSGF